MNSLRVQRSPSYNLQGVVAPDSRRKVRQGLHGREQVCRADRRYVARPAAGTYRRSARHCACPVDRFLGNVWQKALVLVLVQVPVPGGRSGLVGGVPGLAAACLEISLLGGGATWASSSCTRNLWVGHRYVVPRIREFGC